MTIRILPPHLINQIAAGEVVERPASVVKELVENAIDADATKIDIFIRGGGLERMTITDNGHGIGKEDLPIAIERHATSKLANDDLTQIDHLGFRGEALPSIASIARMTITSHKSGQPDAWQIRIDGGQKHPITPAAHNIGTTIDVRDVFFATPARLKFMKSAAAEAAQIADVIRRLAIAKPGISFRLADENRIILDLPASLGDMFSKTRARAISIIGAEFAKNSLPIDAAREGTRLSGFISIPRFSRGNAQMQFFVVNGRPVKDRQLLGALRAAYQDVLAPDRYPYAVLYLDVPAVDVDVNVHPAKTEVRFQDAGKIRSLVIGAIREVLQNSRHQRADTAASSAMVLAFRPKSTMPAGAVFENKPDFAFDYPPFDFTPAARKFDADIHAAADAETYPLGAVIAQVFENYILAQTASGLILVDQHAAHERIVYEKIKSELAASAIKRQILLIPEVIPLPAGLASMLLERAEELSKLGLLIESFGANTVLVREVPAILGQNSMKEMIESLANEISEVEGSLEIEKNLWRICSSMACHGSIRKGRILNIDEMNALLRQIESTPNAAQCNHGRPSFIELGHSDIEKLFGRR